MKNLNRINLSEQTIFQNLPYLVLFVFLVIYFGLFNDYVLFFQEKTSLFVFSRDFLFEHLDKPGGLLIYSGKFFSTFFYIPVLGAVIVSLFITMILIFLSKIIFFLTGRRSTILPFFAGIVIFYLQSDYRFFFFNIIGLFLPLISFYLIIKFSDLSKSRIVFIVIPLIYYLTGCFVGILLLLLTSYFTLNFNKKGFIRIAILLILSFIMVYISNEYIFFQTLETLLLYPFSDENTGSLTILFLVIAGIISLLPLIVRIRILIPGRFHFSGTLFSYVKYALILIVFVLIGIVRFDKDYKQYFFVEKLYYQGKFNEIINYNLKNPTSNSLTIFLNNLALCECNKLNDLLFNFRQDPDGNTLFLKWKMDQEILRRGAYFYYTIGMINEAHRWVYENMVMEGYTPEGLRMLIKTEILNRNFEVADKYISILNKTLFYRKEAGELKKLLFNDEAVTTHPELGPKRRLMVKSDFIIITDYPAINLDRILMRDSMNIRAFEYKIAFLLLKKDSKGIADRLPEFELRGFSKLPVNVEEAVVAYSVLKKRSAQYFRNININKNTEKRFLDFLTLYKKFNSDPVLSEPALREKFGNTFWYYSFYR